MRTLETIKTLNATARTCIATVVIGALGLLGYQGYELYNAPQLALTRTQNELKHTKDNLLKSQQKVGELELVTAEQRKHIDRLETSIRLLKVNHRVAELRVLEQRGTAEDGNLVSKISFVETNDEGNSIGQPSEFEIDGDMVYVDYLVAKFDDKYVEEADLERSTAICLFRRIFGENQEPNEGFELDRVGSRPTAYARGGMNSEFEQKIWDDFWTLANDPSKAAQLGIRAAHGNAASIRVQDGKRYQLKLRSTGEFSLRPM